MVCLPRLWLSRPAQEARTTSSKNNVGSALQRLTTIFAFAALGVALPLGGAYLSGQPIGQYLRFSKDTPSAVSASFEWPAFVLYLAVILATVGPFVWRIVQAEPPRFDAASRMRRFPAWGWLGFAIVVVAWVVAWTRIPALAPWQRYTFTPLWIGYILVVNALVQRRTGRAPLLERPIRFLLLFPASALVWWYFEYLNRFIGNWYYTGIGFVTPLEYLVHASISFSTVLPAVISTRDWLASFPRLRSALTGFVSVRGAEAPAFAWLLLLLGALGYFTLGAWPQYFYSMAWLAPVLVLVSVQALTAQPNALADIRNGDWRGIGLPALAALTAGFFWEMWNWRSLAHWEYVIPLVDRFHLFEMPILGYAGYLPFGIACVILAELVYGGRAARRSKVSDQ